MRDRRVQLELAVATDSQYQLHTKFCLVHLAACLFDKMLFGYYILIVSTPALTILP